MRDIGPHREKLMLQKASKRLNQDLPFFVEACKYLLANQRQIETTHGVRLDMLSEQDSDDSNVVVDSSAVGMGSGSVRIAAKGAKLSFEEISSESASITSESSRRLYKPKMAQIKKAFTEKHFSLASYLVYIEPVLPKTELEQLVCYFAVIMHDQQLCLVFVAQVVLKLITVILPLSEQFMYTQLLSKLDLNEYIRVKETISLRFFVDPVLRNRVSEILGRTTVNRFCMVAQKKYMDETRCMSLQ
jgi:hypothetical protein